MTHITPPPPSPSPAAAIDAEIVPTATDEKDLLIERLTQRIERMEAALPAIPEPIKVHADLEGVYDPDDGAAYAEYVPVDCPVLCSGTRDPSVRLLVRVLNATLGTQLPDDDHVTPAVQQACEQFRAKFNVPQEHGPEVGNVRAWFCGPNLWAAVATIHRQNAAPSTTLATIQ